MGKIIKAYFDRDMRHLVVIAMMGYEAIMAIDPAQLDIEISAVRIEDLEKVKILGDTSIEFPSLGRTFTLEVLFQAWEEQYNSYTDNDTNPHPEQLDDECFIANFVNQDVFYECTWKTKRVGNIAYDTSGNRITDMKWRPIFVKKFEIEERIAKYEAEKNQRSADDLRNMLIRNGAGR